MLEASGGAPITCCCASAPLQATEAIEINATANARRFILFSPNRSMPICVGHFSLHTKKFQRFPVMSGWKLTRKRGSNTPLTCNHLVAYCHCMDRGHG